MSAYDVDPRVACYNDGSLYEVDTTDGRVSVCRWGDVWALVTEPAGRFGAEFATDDEAIRSLIGDPQ